MERLDFDSLVKQVEELGTNAQATLMYRLSKVLGAGVLRSSIKYSFQRLDQINADLPDGHPYKERYKNYKSMSMSNVGIRIIDPKKATFHDRDNQTHQPSAE